MNIVYLWMSMHIACHTIVYLSSGSSWFTVYLTRTAAVNLVSLASLAESSFDIVTVPTTSATTCCILATWGPWISRSLYLERPMIETNL